MVDERTDMAARAETAWRIHADRFMPWIISFGAHTLLIVVGFLVVWTVAPATFEERPEIVVSFDNPSPAPVSLPSAVEPVSAGASSAAVPAVSLPPVPELPSARGLSAVTTLSRAAPSAVEQRQDAIEERRLPEVRFAGLGVSNATKIIYVVDASGSMVSTFPVVMNYLERSISRLARTQRFQVVFYGREGFRAAPHPGDVDDGAHWRLIRATPENVRATLEWARTVIPGGKSNPVPALEFALHLDHPDAVFLLSNVVTGAGQWEADKDGILRALDALNPVDATTGRRRTVIKTLQFLDEDPAGIIEAIGLAHGGEGGYKYIPRGDGENR